MTDIDREIDQYVDDPSNVTQIGERRGDPIYPDPDLDEPASMFDPSTVPPIDWDDTPHTINEIPPDSQPPRPPPPSPSTGSTRRQQIIDEATDLANTALEAWKQAIDVMGIIDIGAGEKYSQLTRGIASAVEDWENKL